MVRELRVQNFRKHQDIQLRLQPGVTIITGPNGSGKTSLIEALYITLRGKSWRSGFHEILSNQTESPAEWWRIDTTFEDGETRTVKFTGGQKTFELQGKAYARLPQRFKKPVVLFEPNDLLLLYGSPARRRDFFDRFVEQTEPGYTTTLRKFERVLAQRNSLLKQGSSQDELFAWDMQFVALAEKITTARSRWIDYVNNSLTDQYRAISGTDDTISITYSAPQQTSQQVLQQLHHDATQGYLYTKTGPQTHDVLFTLNGRDAKQTASRGENRTILFAVLGAMADNLHTLFDEPVYLILDDVDSELDTDRKKRLYKTKSFVENVVFATTIQHSGKPSNHLRLG